MMDFYCPRVKIEGGHVLLEISDVFLYRIPINIYKPENAYRAKKWDLSSPEGSFKLIVVDAGISCNIQLLDENLEIYGQSFLDCYPQENSLEISKLRAVSDSSRYFVISLQNYSGEYEEIHGIGFASHADSSQFVNTLCSYFAPPPPTNPTAKTFQEVSPPQEQEQHTFTRKKRRKGFCSIKESSKIVMPYHCQLCSDSFLTADMLKGHIETSHEKKAESILFYCNVLDCKKRFLSEVTLDRHRTVIHPKSCNIDEPNSGISPIFEGATPTTTSFPVPVPVPAAVTIIEHNKNAAVVEVDLSGDSDHDNFKISTVVTR